MEFVPLDIVGVVTAEVGQPRNDGTAGSSLYAVPIQLSRRVDAAEEAVLRQTWDHPPSFTSMHRPGIARIGGDRIILDGTTVEEVAKYHAATLRAVVDKFNTDMAEIRRREAADDARREAEAEAHRRNVEDVGGQIKFS